MGFGCVYTNRGSMATEANLVKFGQTAEALAFDTVWTSDHIVMPMEVGSARHVMLAKSYYAMVDSNP